MTSDRTQWLAMAATCLAASPAMAQEAVAVEAPAAPPTVTLANDAVRITVAVPDAERGFYRGVRFDPSALVIEVRAFGHTFFEPWVGSSGQAHDIHGTAEEFDLDKALGHDFAKPGEPFVKVGVGVLRRVDHKPYRFGRKYPVIKRLPWDVRRGDDWLQFDQRLRAANPHAPGWSYVLTKRLTLEADGFTVRRTLHNTGKKDIDLNHYAHNFLCIDGAARFGPDYRIEAGFALTPDKMNTQAQKMLVFEDKTLTLSEPLERGSLWARFVPPQSAGAQAHRIRVTHTRTGGWVSIEGDRPLAYLAVWAADNVVCPEPFVRVQLEPGEKMTWSSRYRFGGED